NNNNKGVANVMVSLKPPAGHYFPIDKSIDFPKEKVIDQPHCAFIPHVQVTFPVYWDGAKYVRSGQKFVVKNSAELPNNAKYEGETDIGSDNLLVPAGTTKEVAFRKASRKPINFSCSFHPWMRAIVWAFDHPYATVTDKDGNFEIKNVPTGAELQLVAWHEARENFHDTNLTLPKGQTNQLNFTINS